MSALILWIEKDLTELSFKKISPNILKRWYLIVLKRDQNETVKGKSQISRRIFLPVNKLHSQNLNILQTIRKKFNFINTRKNSRDSCLG